MITDLVQWRNHNHNTSNNNNKNKAITTIMLVDNNYYLTLPMINLEND